MKTYTEAEILKNLKECIKYCKTDMESSLTHCFNENKTKDELITLLNQSAECANGCISFAFYMDVITPSECERMMDNISNYKTQMIIQFQSNECTFNVNGWSD